MAVCSSSDFRSRGIPMWRDLLPIQYIRSYNEGRGLPEPHWGKELKGLQCPTCGSKRMCSSASPDDPEEIFPGETVRCLHCGHIIDWNEAHKQAINHPTNRPRKVVYD